MQPSSAICSHSGGQLVSVLLPLPLTGAYDYRVPAGLVLGTGQVVAVPLGARVVTGVVWGEGMGGVEAAKLKEVLEPRQVPGLTDASLRFVDWVAAYTLSPPGAVLKMVLSVPAALEPAKPVTAYGLAAPASDSEIRQIKMTPARQRVLDVLAQNPPLRLAELAREAAVGPAVVKGLARAGMLATRQLAAPPPHAEPCWNAEAVSLSAAQQAAAAQLVGSMDRGGFGVTLLDGVPGSGKTEVYFHAVARALEQGNQALVLLPEIALSAQWLERFRARFGVAPALWHSELTPARRRATWRAVAEGQARVVVGARSALFLPYPDLGLIVVDEEHDAAYKQEDGVIYNARDMAVVRARIGGFPLIAVSATPSLETVTNVEEGRYESIRLPDRHGGATLPQVQTVDMREDGPAPGQWLSGALCAAVEETLAAGEQALLFLNRRGYAPLTLCRACGFRLQCPRCTAWLVEHRRAGRLLCHHCGHGAGRPVHCPQCRAEDSFAACGPGVERLAEEVAERFPGVRAIIAASDTVSGPAAAARLVKRIEDHQVDLIIGTQIVAKGYHFPLLTLVGVVDGDLGLTGGDLRAAERTYQLLYQVAGRAGREGRDGRVLVQTYMPEHPVMAALVSGDRDRFLSAEAEARRQAGMPPFGRLAALIVSARDAGAAERVAREVAARAPRAPDVQVLGPAPAPMALLRGRHRFRLLIKAGRRTNLQKVLAGWVGQGAGALRPPSGVRIQIDIDPYSFL